LAGGGEHFYGVLTGPLEAQRCGDNDGDASE